MISSESLVGLVDEVLRPSGALRKGKAWYWRGSEVIRMVELLKSSYDNSYYVNFGFWFLSLEPADKPPPHKFHLKFRAESYLAIDAKRYREILRLDSHVPLNERRDELQRMLTVLIIPFLERGATKSGVVEMIAEGTIPSYLITANASKALQGSIPVG